MGKLDLGDIKMRFDLIRKRLIPILDVLVIVNIKIEQLIEAGQDVPEDLIATRDKMYERALEILKTEGI